jgi:hypothetical protein
MKVDKKIRDWLLDIQSNNKIFLEGNILKIIESDTKDEEFTKYIEDANNKDKEIRRKRLDVTKQIQEQNKNLLTAQEENVKINEDLKMALESAEDEKKKAELSKIEAIKAKDDALNDLDILQK